MILKVYTDGGSRGNPGPSSIGMVFYIENKKIFHHHESIGIATNNEAEYIALTKALENIKNQILNIKNTYQISKINFYSDSKLMVNQVNGLFKVKQGKIKEYIFKIRGLEQEINTPISYHLIPREQNQEADRLVNSL
ncbi:MAG: ribonuclease HI family protein [Candidatus Roizmanbacteria bacterium]